MVNGWKQRRLGKGLLGCEEEERYQITHVKWKPQNNAGLIITLANFSLEEEPRTEFLHKVLYRQCYLRPIVDMSFINFVASPATI